MIYITVYLAISSALFIWVMGLYRAAVVHGAVSTGDIDIFFIVGVVAYLAWPLIAVVTLIWTGSVLLSWLLQRARARLFAKESAR